MSVPSKGETFAALIDHLRNAQEQAAVLGHLAYSNQEQSLGDAWLNVSELLKRTQYNVTQLAVKGLH